MGKLDPQSPDWEWGKQRQQCIAFAKYVQENWNKLAEPARVHYERMYAEWVRDNESGK